MQEELLNLLNPRKGHFKLESGHHGDLWLDLERLFLRPGAARRFVIELANKLSRYNIAAVCGPLVGGALVAQMIALELEVEFYYAERFSRPQPDALYPVEYRLPNALRPMLRGKDVALVDDAINAGSAVRATLTALGACAASVVVIGALFVLGASGPTFFANQNIPLETVSYLPGGLWTPAECPLCASQTPLEDITANSRIWH
jgi:orotate phosphoribosyltransferase